MSCGAAGGAQAVCVRPAARLPASKCDPLLHTPSATGAQPLLRSRACFKTGAHRGRCWWGPGREWRELRQEGRKVRAIAEPAGISMRHSFER